MTTVTVKDALRALSARSRAERTRLRKENHLSLHLNTELCFKAVDEELTALRRLVVCLAQAAVKASGDPEALERALVFATGAHDDEDDDEADAPEPTAFEAAAGSPYRDAARAIPGLPTCGACGKALEPDDPEMTLGRYGRVCMPCFQRHGAE
jgi:hypothetical protein